MPETRTPVPITHTPAPLPHGYCSWHGASDSGVRLIHAVEQCSGPGGGVYACLPCIAEHELVPFVDQP